MTALLFDSALRVSLVTATCLGALVCLWRSCRDSSLGAGLGDRVCAGDSRASAARALLAGRGCGAVAPAATLALPRGRSGPGGAPAPQALRLLT